MKPSAPALSRLSGAIDAVSEWTGQTVAWLTLFMVLITFLIVVLRYGFNIGAIRLQESVVYMHAAVFMLGAGFVLKRDAHVRVDIFYRRLSPRGQAWVDLLGILLLLLPWMIFMMWISWDYVASAWSLKEGSRETGGLPYLYLLKTLIVLMPLLVAVQALSKACQAVLTLTGQRPGGASS